MALQYNVSKENIDADDLNFFTKMIMALLNAIVFMFYFLRKYPIRA